MHKVNIPPSVCQQKICYSVLILVRTLINDLNNCTMKEGQSRHDLDEFHNNQALQLMLLPTDISTAQTFYSKTIQLRKDQNVNISNLGYSV